MLSAYPVRPFSEGPGRPEARGVTGDGPASHRASQRIGGGGTPPSAIAGVDAAADGIGMREHHDARTKNFDGIAADGPGG
jgi:hypothetical protein